MLLAPRHALALLLPLLAAACRSEPTAAIEPPKIAPAQAETAPPLAAPTPKASASAASDAAEKPGDTPGNDNPGCTVRKNTGVISACEAHTGNLGTWAPTPRETAGVMALVGDVCYCASGLQIPSLTCAKRVKSGTVKLNVGKLGDPTDCALTISAASWNKRRWVVVDAVNRDVATFYTVLTIYEYTEGGFKRYYQGFNGLPDEESMKTGAEGVSPALKHDWPTLPAEVRAALGGGSP